MENWTTELNCGFRLIEYLLTCAAQFVESFSGDRCIVYSAWVFLANTIIALTIGQALHLKWISEVFLCQ